MKYSLGVEQALHVLLAFMDEKSGKIGVQQVADYFKVSPTYLSKIMTKLTKSGILRSITGVKGGYELARQPEQITFWDVVEAIEGKGDLFQCTNIRFNSMKKATDTDFQIPAELLNTPCSIHSVFIEAERRLRETLQEQTLADLQQQVQQKLSKFKMV